MKHGKDEEWGWRWQHREKHLVDKRKKVKIKEWMVNSGFIKVEFNRQSTLIPKVNSKETLKLLIMEKKVKYCLCRSEIAVTLKAVFLYLWPISLFNVYWCHSPTIKSQSLPHYSAPVNKILYWLPWILTFFLKFLHFGHFAPPWPHFGRFS